MSIINFQQIVETLLYRESESVSGGMKTETTEFGTCGMLPSDVMHNDPVLNPIKSRISVEYVQALCAYLDLECSEPHSGNDRDGFDIMVSPVIGRSNWMGIVPLRMQLKATSVPDIRDGFLHYRLDSRSYSLMKRVNTSGNSILAVLCLDQDTGRWVDVDGDHLGIRRVMYWCHPGSYPDLEDGQESLTIRIPCDNVLDAATLHRMVDAVCSNRRLSNHV